MASLGDVKTREWKPCVEGCAALRVVKLLWCAGEHDRGRDARHGWLIYPAVKQDGLTTCSGLFVDGRSCLPSRQ